MLMTMSQMSQLPPNTITDIFSLARIAEQRPLAEDELEQLNNASAGLNRTLGLRYVEVGPERVVSELRVTANHLQPAGLVNGGVFSALAESVGSLAGVIADEELSPVYVIPGAFDKRVAAAVAKAARKFATV